jgi:hypothetical protein
MPFSSANLLLLRTSLIAVCLVVAAVAITTWAMLADQLRGGSRDDAPHPATSDASSSLVRLAWFYKPPTDAELDLLQERFDTFILTKQDEPARDWLRARGQEGPFLQYLRFEAIHDPGSCARQPWRNQVADQPGDFCRLVADHPDWFLLDGYGKRIVEYTQGERFVLMDPGHPGWRAFWLERARASQEQLSWDGVFLDNVEASLFKHRRAGRTLAAYPDEAGYQAAIDGFLRFLYTGYFQPEARPLWANIIALDESEVWFKYLESLDGAMDEGWAVDWSDGYLSRARWEEHLDRVEQTQALGKEVVLVAQGARGDLERQTFAFASYLLVSDGGASFRYSHKTAYHQPWLYNNYNLELGIPRGTRYESNGLWQRDFERGTVIVDPGKGTARIITNDDDP